MKMKTMTIVHSREIKFRAWDSKYEKMYYSHGDNSRVNCFSGDWEIDLEAENGDTIGTVGCNEKTYPLMQYTGLKSKTGKEIYEGDIIREVETDDIGQVKWYQDCCEYQINGDWGISCMVSDIEYEVIGNIHENPDLLDS